MALTPAPIIIAGGGIGGLAAALALAQAGQNSVVLEQAQRFEALGAGLQLSPNAMRRLHDWGLASDLKKVCSYPGQLTVRLAKSGRTLGALSLDTAMRRYGAPYATVHRADLHGVLLQAIQAQGCADLHQNQAVQAYRLAGPDAVQVSTDSGAIFLGAALLGADGLRSRVRQQMLGDGEPQATGHLFYRAVVQQAQLPQSLRSQEICVWLGAKCHLVAYPVRGGECLNIAAIVHGALANDEQVWDQTATASQVHAAMREVCTPLADLVGAVQDWRVWAGYERAPMVRAAQHSQGRVALLGDAAHPMRPYMAQGAAMAIEDAQTLVQAFVSQSAIGARSGASAWPAAFAQFGQERWQRNARVQARAVRNGRLFHAQGPLAWARNAGISLFGRRVLDVPWLYSA